MSDAKKPAVYTLDGETFYGYPHPIVSNELKPGAILRGNTDVNPLTKDISGERSTSFALSTLDDD